MNEGRLGGQVKSAAESFVIPCRNLQCRCIVLQKSLKLRLN